MYSQEALEKLTKDSLLKLAKYLDVPNVKQRNLKGQIIEAILDWTKEQVEEEADPPMSVRIRRIKESQEK